MSQTLQQESLIVALSKCAIKISTEKISEKFNCFVLKIVLCQQGRFSKIRSQIILLPVLKLSSKYRLLNRYEDMHYIL